MNNLVNINNGIASTTSLLIAELFGRPHDNVLKSLDKLKDVVGFNATSYIDSMNRVQRAYELTERQALIAMPFIGGEKSLQGQVALVDAFLELRTTVNHLLIHFEQLDIAEQFSIALKKTNKIKQVREREDLYNYLDGREWDALYAIEFGGNMGVSENELIKNNAGYQKMPIKIRKRFEKILVEKEHIVVIFIYNKQGVEEKTFFIR